MSKVKIGLNYKTILVTGSPGFIGANLVLRLLKEMKSGTVISLDNMNDYYDPALKEYRLGGSCKGFSCETYLHQRIYCRQGAD